MQRAPAYPTNLNELQLNLVSKLGRAAHQWSERVDFLAACDKSNIEFLSFDCQHHHRVCHFKSTEEP